MKLCSEIVASHSRISTQGLRCFHDCLDLHDPLEPGFLYLVQESWQRSQLIERFLERFPAAFEAPVETLQSWLNALCLTASPGLQVLSEIEKRALLEDLMDSSDFRFLRGLERPSGLVSHLSRYIAFVKQQNIEDEQMLRLQHLRFETLPSAAEEELIRLFSSYQGALDHRQLQDQEGARTLLYHALLTGRLEFQRSYPSLRRLVLDLPVHLLSVQQKAILALLAEQVEEVIAVVEPLESRPPLQEWIESRAEALHFLKPDWESAATPVKSQEFDVSLFRPGSMRDEVIQVAAQILELSQGNSSFDYASIVLVGNELSDYRRLLEEVFSEWRIPVQFRKGRPFARSTKVRAFLNYLRVLEADFQSNDLFDLLLTPPVSVPGINSTRLHWIEEIAAAGGLRGGLGKWLDELPEVWAFVRRKPGGQHYEMEWKGQEQEVFESFWAALKNLTLDTSQLRAPLEWLRLSLGRLEPVLQLSSTESDWQTRRCENLLFRGFLEGVLAEASVRESRAISFPRFVKWMEAQRGGQAVENRLDEEGVRVGRPEEFVSTPVAFLFWLGLTEASAAPSQPYPVFFDEIRSSQWGGRTQRELQLEQTAVLGQLTHSAKRVWLSCPERKGDSPQSWSPAVEQLFLSDKKRTLVVSECRSASRWGELSPHRPSRATLDNVGRGKQVQIARESNVSGRFDGLLRQPEALAEFRRQRFPKAIEVSPSQLEDYMRCGFRYYLARVLKLRPPLEMEPGLEPAERGSLVHRVLFRFLSESGEKPSRFDSESRVEWTLRQRQRMGAILREEMAFLRPSEERGRGVFWKHQESKMAAGLFEEGHGLLSEFIDQHWERLQEFSTQCLELKLGPIQIGTLGAGGNHPRLIPVQLRGKLDRIDADQDGLYVIDYKTGQDQLPRIFQGWGFQLPLYALLAAEKLKRSSVRAAFYTLRLPLEVSLKEVRLQTQPPGESGFPRLINYYRERALEVARHLYQGDFPVSLLSEAEAGCAHCTFQRVCRRDGRKMEHARRSGDFLSKEDLRESKVGEPRSAEGKSWGRRAL